MTGKTATQHPSAPKQTLSREQAQLARECAAPWDVQWLRQVARDPDARALPSSVAAIMSIHMDGTSRETFCSQTTLADDLGVSVDGIRKATKRLVEGGHLALVQQGHGGRTDGSSKPNTYRAVLFPRQLSGETVGQSPAARLGKSYSKSPDDRPEIPRQSSAIPQTEVGTIPDSYPTKISHLSEGRSPTSDQENTAAWDLAKALLSERGGMTKAQAGDFFGGLLKRHGLKAGEMMPALLTANDSGTPELRPYLTKAAQSVAQQKRANAPGGRNGREAQYADRLSEISAAMRAAAGR